jgi:hypothetical protein
MSVTCVEIKELMGEHEGIRAHMKFLMRSRENMVAKDARVKEQIWSYRCGLYDFRDAMRNHQELDERIFQSLPGNVSPGELAEDHHEIQKIIDDLIALTENAESVVTDRFDQAKLYPLAQKIGLAFNKIYELIEAHINKENAILDAALKQILV